jgi:hypothetical protein
VTKLVRAKPALLLLPLALLFTVVGLVEASRDAATVDEAIDVASGVTGIVRRDVGLTPEHGVLVKFLPAVPALLAHPVVPDGPGYQKGDWFDNTDDFVRANMAAGKWNDILFYARIVALIEGLAVAALLYVLGAKLFGAWAGVVASALWLTTPVFVGFSHVVGIDVAFTLATLVVSLALLYHLDRRSNWSALWLGLALGAALLTRHIALVLVLVALVIVVGDMWRRNRRDAARLAGIVAVVSWATVWVVMRGIAWTSRGGVAGQQLSAVISTERHNSFLTRLVLAPPWPKEWAAGYAYLILTSAAKPAYLLGQAWDGNRWWFFPGSLLVKMPLPALAVLVIGLFGWRRYDRSIRNRGLLVIAAPALAIALVVAVQPLNLGLRYVFAPVALWFVAAGPIVRLGKPSWRVAGAALVLASQLAAFVAATPHSMAWTPPPFRPAYQYATDSNVDYGQDEREVERWARTLNEPLYTDLLVPRGVDPPPNSKPLIGTPPEDIRGWVAVSATRLTALDRDELSWLRAYCPVFTINGSVLVYRFEEPVDTSPGPTEPAAPCSGDVSTR